MWSFYNRHTKQRIDTWQNQLFGRSNVSCSWVTLKYLWLKTLLLLLFCLDSFCASTESTISVPLFNVESLQKPNFSVLKKISNAQDTQQSEIPVWKPEVLKCMLEALKAQAMMEEQTNTVISQKLYKQSRLFKRDLPKYSLMALTLAEIFSQCVNQTTNSNMRSLSSVPEDPLHESFNDLLMTPSLVTVLRPDLSKTTPTPAKWDPPSETMQTPTKWNPLSEITSVPAKWGPLSETMQVPAKWDPLSEMTSVPAKWNPLSETMQVPAKWGLLYEMTSVPAKWGPLSETMTTPARWSPPSETKMMTPARWGPLFDTTAPPRWDPLSEMRTTSSKSDPLSETTMTPARWGTLSETQTLPTRWGPLSETKMTPTRMSPLSEMITMLTKSGPLSETMTPARWDLLSERQTPPTMRGPLSKMQTPPARLDNVVSHTNPFLNTKTLTAVEGHMLSTLKDTTFARPEDMSSTGSLKKQEQAAASDKLMQSEGTLYTTPHNLSYSSGKPIAKLINYPNLSGSPFPVTDRTKVPSENSSHQSSKFNYEIRLGYTNNGFNVLSNSDHKTVEPATNLFNELDATVQPEHKTSSISNMSTPSLETSPTSPQFSNVPGSLISPTNSTLENSTESVNTKLYSEPFLPIIQFDSLEVDMNQTSVMPPTLAIDDGSSTKRNIETLTPLNTEHADTAYTTTRGIGSSPAAYGTPVGTFFTLSGLGRHVEQDLSSAPTIPHTSKTDQASHHRLEQQRGTLRSLSASTWPSQTMGTVETSHTISLAQTDFNTLSSAQSMHRVKNKTCILQIDDPANTQTPETSKTSIMSTVYKSTDYEGDTSVLSTSSSVTPYDESTLVESTLTAGLELQSTMIPLLANDAFNDVISGNGAINQSTLNITSTLSSTVSSTWISKPFTSVTSLWKSRTSQQFNSTVQSMQNIKTSKSTLYSSVPSNIYASGSKPPNTTIPDALPNIGPLTRAPSKTQTASSTMPSRLATSAQSNEITLEHTTLAFKVFPVPKVWNPTTDLPLKPTGAIPINTRQRLSSTATTITPAVTMPLNFHITGVSFSEQLTNHTNMEYRQLEREVKLVMDKILFAKYQNGYKETEIVGFMNGSVVVQSIIVFRNKIDMPSSSHVIRTVLTDGTKTNYFGWSINSSTVESNGYTSSNLELEVLPISFLVLRAGFMAVSQRNQEKLSFLDNLQKAVFQAINASFPITNVSISQIRDVFGDLKVRGDLSLNSKVHTDVQSLMSSLVPLVNRSVDLSSILVNGIVNEVKVHSINFRVINKPFELNLLDMSSSESQLLSKNLSGVVQTILHDSNPLQVIMREFKSGSVICRGDLVYQLPAPGSGEVLRLLLNTLGSDGTLGSSTYKVDSKTVTIGDSSPGPSYEYVDFPGFGVAIIVMCGLCILIFPIILFVCIKTRMLGRRKKATIQRRHDHEDQSHHLEMDNRAFRASIEQP